jgi:F-type H+-transporting ATPase subunit alpha
MTEPRIQPDEITSVLEQELARYEPQLEVEEVGTVLEVGDGIARIYGLSGAMSGEMLDFGNDLYGLALNLEEDVIGAVIMGEDVEIGEGDEVRRTGRLLEVPVGDALLGRVVNPVGHPWTARARSPPTAPARSSSTRPASSIGSRSRNLSRRDSRRSTR